MQNFVEKISEVEGHFDLYGSVFLKYENLFVLSLKDSKDWVTENGRRKASLSTFGGKIDENIDIIQFLKNTCFQELGIHIDIYDSPYAYIDYHHHLKRIPLDVKKGEICPQIITIVHKQSHFTSVSSNTINFSYLAYTKEKPNSGDYSALLFAREHILLQMFKNEKSVQDLRKNGAIFLERIRIPDDLFLYPQGSLNSLLRFLSYEVF